MKVNEFHDLVKKGNLDEVKTAVQTDPSLATALNASGQSSFILAKYYRQHETASYLLSILPSLDVFEACVAGRTETVLENLKERPELLKTRNGDGWTPLHLA